MERVANKDMGGAVTRLALFKNNNETVFSAHFGHLYAVYSYGPHFPMYVFDKDAQMWFGNSSKYSATTSRHQSQAWPNTTAEIHWLNNEQMIKLVNLGGYVEMVADRVKREAAA